MSLYQEIQTPSATYTFHLYPVGTKFKRLSGIYLFIIQSPIQDNISHLLYIGIATDFYARLKNHHKLDQAIQLGMTHIGIHKKSSGRTRKKIEKQLLQNLNPPLNQTWLIDQQP